MVNTALLAILEEKDHTRFENFIKGMEVGRVTPEEETQFFKTAPDDWLYEYICVSYPQPASERVLMISASVETLKRSYDLWGFWEENVIWAFMAGTHDVCKKVITCMTSRPSYEAEELMLKRNSRELFTMWIEKYKVLSEDAEKLLHDDIKLSQLKSIYIEYQLNEPFRLAPV
ncbi:MAG: hypothetical protein IJ019_03705 [Alphaproteobacteria bacterium]|nr:hypothetical protein [Alphaproteobacteria bacterium]